MALLARVRSKPQALGIDQQSIQTLYTAEWRQEIPRAAFPGLSPNAAPSLFRVHARLVVDQAMPPMTKEEEGHGLEAGVLNVPPPLPGTASSCASLHFGEVRYMLRAPSAPFSTSLSSPSTPEAGTERKRLPGSAQSHAWFLRPAEDFWVLAPVAALSKLHGNNLAARRVQKTNCPCGMDPPKARFVLLFDVS